jgi:fructose-1,6-bisphosphatase/sedoheptulose 1,7-bisphosphatase-like protein
MADRSHLIEEDPAYIPWVGLKYAAKLAGPPALMHGVSLDYELRDPSTESLEQGALDNLQTIAKNGKLHPADMTVVVLDRARNNHVIGAANELGTKIQLIDSGDFAAGELAIHSNPTRPTIAAGSGGFPEGLLLAHIDLAQPHNYDGHRPRGNAFQMVALAVDQEEQELMRRLSAERNPAVGQVLNRQTLIRSGNAVLAVASITGEPQLGYDRALRTGDQTLVHVRTFGIRDFSPIPSKNQTVQVPNF